MTEDKRRLPAWVLFTIAIAVGLCAAAPLWGAGMVNTRGGGDSPFLLQRTADMAENLSHGIFPPRWMSHGAYGLGYPFFNHYAALPYYISGGLTALHMDIVLSIQVTQTLGFVLAAIAVTAWAQQLARSDLAVIAITAAYTFAPFHLVNVYVRGDSLSEFYAFVWYPLILWSLYRAVQHPRARRIIVAGLCYGALVITHNVSAVIFSPFALVYALWLTYHHQDSRFKKWQPYALIMLPFILGMLYSAWFWLPALGETGYVHMGDEFTAGYFHYSNHFRTLNLVQLNLTFDYSVANVVQAAGPFSMSLVQALFALAGFARAVVTLVKRQGTPAQRRSLIFITGGFLLATAMITPLSQPLWRYLPLLELTQFPWRFLSIQALFTAALTGLLFVPLCENDGIETTVPEPTEIHGSEDPHSGTKQHWLHITGLVAVVGLSVLSAVWQLKPERLLLGDEAESWDSLATYETFTGNIGTTIRYEYLPEAVNPRPYISEYVVGGEGKILTLNNTLENDSLVERTPNKQQWTMTLSTDDSVSFPLYWWPGWHAQVDGLDTAAYAMPGSGRLTMDLTAGQHAVTLFMRNTIPQTLGIAISLTILISSIVIAFLEKAPWSSLTPQTVVLVCLVITLSLTFPALNRGTSTAHAPFFDFDAMPFPHAGPVIFPDATLYDVQLSAETVSPGNTLDVGLGWSISAGETLTTVVSLVSPAEARHGVDYALASTELPIAPVMRARLALPKDLSWGVYLVKVQVVDEMEEHFGRTENGTGMGTLYAGVVRVEQGATAQGLPVLAEFTEMTLHTLDAKQTSDTELKLKLGWSTPGTLNNWTLSYRLLNIYGEQLTHPDGSAIQLDIEPGYGYLPTTLWTPGELVADYVTLPLPEGLAPGDYMLRMIAYQRNGLAGGEADLPLALTKPTYYDLRDSCCEQTRKGKTILCQDSGIALLALEAPDSINEGEDLIMYAQWNALELPQAEVQTSWSLRDEEGTIISSASGPLAVGSQNMTWSRFTWVRSPVHFDLPSLLPGGTHTVHLTMKSEHSEENCDLQRMIDVLPRPRQFDLPVLENPQNAVFGETIRLLGYDMQQDRKANTLELTLWWQALTSPNLDYKRFVHIYDPATEQMLIQDDAIPRNWTYPTSWWLAGEVVSETITLDISTASARTYAVGIGWYDPATLTRLTVTGVDAAVDRVTLDAAVKIR